MFDGSYKSRRGVSLSGRSKNRNVDKKVFLKRARDERSERALERLRNKCSLVIQAAWRGLHCRARLRDDLRVIWDKKIHDLKQVEQIFAASGASFVVPTKTLVEVLREFLAFFGDHAEDRDRFWEMCRLVTRHIAAQISPGTSSDQGYLSLAVGDSTQASTWRFQLSRLLGHALVGLLLWPSEPVRTLVTTLSTDQVLSGFALKEQVTFKNELQKMRLQVFCHGGPRSSTFSRLQHQIKTDKLSEEGQKEIAGVSSFIMRVVTESPTSSQVATRPLYFAFFRDMLSAGNATDNAYLRLLVNAVYAKTSTTALRRFWREAAEYPMHLGQTDSSKASSIYLLGNLVWLLNESHADLASASLSDAIEALSLLVSHGQARNGGSLSIGHVLAKQSITGSADIVQTPFEEDVDESAENEESGDLEPLLRRYHNTQFTPEYEGEVRAMIEMRKQLSLILSPRLVKLLFSAVDVTPLSSKAASFSPTEEKSPYSEGADTQTISEPPILQVCNLYFQILPTEELLSVVNPTQLPRGSILSVINSIAWSRTESATVLKRMWWLGKEYIGLQDLLDMSRKEVKRTIPFWFFFLASYSHLLLAQADDEFRSGGIPFELDVVRDICDWLRTVLHRLYWVEDWIFTPSPSLGPSISDSGNLSSMPNSHLSNTNGSLARSTAASPFNALLLLAVATKLFNALYNRNCRLSFLPDERWQWTSSRQSEFELTLDGRFQHARAARVLRNIPQVLPFHQRVVIFHQLISLDRGGRESSALDMFTRPPSSWIRARRQYVYEDSFAAVNALGPRLRDRVQVQLINDQGLEEAGIDGGGVFKEYMDILTKRCFDPQYALFHATDDQRLYPNPASALAMDNHLQHFEFAGRVLGKALYEGILVEPQFAPFFLNKLLGRTNQLGDLQSLDPELYRNLMYLKTFEGDVRELELTFEVTRNEFGENLSEELIPGGAHMVVDNSNKLQYIHLLAHFKLNVQIAAQCQAFLRGFRDLVPQRGMLMFSPQELQMLIGGDSEDFDVDDMRRNTKYASGYHDSQPYVQCFWEVVGELSSQERGELLKFITSCSRKPLLGFSQLNPPLCIQEVSGEDRLPTSATCMNLLKLPRYGNKITLKEKLLYAISSGAGFELS